MKGVAAIVVAVVLAGCDFLYGVAGVHETCHGVECAAP